jgi:hypothetical protein
MKKTLLLFGAITLLTNTGCLVAEGGRHEHARFEGPPAVVVVPPPEVVFRPPEVIVR